MKKSILLSIIITLLLFPTIALAKGGHAGGHGGHHGGSHSSHTSKSGSVKSGGSKSSNTVKSGKTESKSSSNTSKHSIFNIGGKSTFKKNEFKASSIATPVSSWKSLNTETKYFTDKTNNIPQLYRGSSATNILLYQPLFHPKHHYIPKNENSEDLEKEDENKNNFKIIFIVGVVIFIALGLFSIIFI